MFVRLVAFLLLFSGSAYAQTVALRAGHLVDPATGSVATNQIILVQEGKITAVGEGVEIPADAQVVDLSNAWVLPGLMDAHTHVTLGMPAGQYQLESEYLKASSTLRALKGLRNAQDMLRAGFTAIRDVGNEANYAVVDLRRALEQGWFSGPTVLSAGKIIAPFGGQSIGIPPEIGHFWRFEYLDADTPDEVRKAVREDIYYGANLIKLVADNSPFFYTREEIEAAAEEAHRAGLTLAVHAYGGEAARNAILGGADSIEHGFDLSDDLLRLMKEKGTVLVGTDFPYEHLQAIGTAGGLLPPPEVMSPKIIDRLKRAHRIGVKMAFGTDVVVELPGKNRGEMMLDYLDVWTTAGIPPAEILKAMTTNVAELFHWQGERGAIAPGQAADIIATAGNPLKDIHALRTVSFVMKDGKIIQPEK